MTALAIAELSTTDAFSPRASARAVCCLLCYKLMRIAYWVGGRGSGRASQDSRLGSQKGGVEFINFPFGSFGSEICSEQLRSAAARIRARIQKSQHRSRGRPRTQESRNLISDPNSWPYDPNMLFPLFFLNIVHKYALYDPIIP